MFSRKNGDKLIEAEGQFRIGITLVFAVIMVAIYLAFPETMGVGSWLQ